MSNTASAGEDVLSFLETLDEMTAKPAATASSARRNASPAKRANLPLNPSGNAGGAQEVLSFLDEITTSTSAAPTLVPPATQIPIQPPTAQIQPPQIPTQSSPIANAPPSGAAAPPPSGFVPAPRTTAHPRSRHAPPPESALPVSHVPHVRTTSFVPDADPVHGNVLPAAPSPAIPEEREQQAQGQGQGQGWSWGSLISSTSKLIETAREQVGAGEKAIVERVKKMGIDVGGIREAGWFLTHEVRS